MKHRLDTLLRPRSVAVIGASAREDPMDEWSLENLIRGGFGGNIYPVNPVIVSENSCVAVDALVVGTTKGD